MSDKQKAVSEADKKWMLKFKGNTKDDIYRSFLNNLEYNIAKDRYSLTLYDEFLSLSLTVRERLIERWIASRHGITKYGISMPLPAPGEDKIIFSVNIASNDADWPKRRGELAKRFMPFAKSFDARMRPLIKAVEKGDSVFKLQG